MIPNISIQTKNQWVDDNMKTTNKPFCNSQFTFDSHEYLKMSFQQKNEHKLDQRS